jgi:hypothetical protein
LAAAIAFLIAYESKGFSAAFLIMGFCSLIAGASLERRWRNWSRQAGADVQSSGSNLEK